MTPPASKPTPTAEEIEAAIIVAGLALATGKTRKERRQAWERLEALRAQRAEAKREPQSKE